MLPMFLGVQPNRIRETQTLSGFVALSSRLLEVVCHPVFPAPSILICFPRRTFGLASISFRSRLSFLFHWLSPRPLVASSRSSSFLPRILIPEFSDYVHSAYVLRREVVFGNFFIIRTEPLITYALRHCPSPRCVEPPD